MKVLHTISGMSLKSGGPSLSTFVLVSGLRDVGVEAAIVTYASGADGSSPIATDAFIQFLSPPKSNRYGYSKEFNRLFAKQNKIELYHAHGLWQYSSHATAVWASRVNKPYLISPRGMLYPTALSRTSLIKKVALLLYQKRDLDRASCIHATCEQEYEYIRACGISKPPVIIIPNAIDIRGIQTRKPQKRLKKRIGFVGRFAPIKNIETLIRAWAKTGGRKVGWELVLVGDGETCYRQELESLAFAELGLTNVMFAGFLSGKTKNEIFASLDCLVLPSRSENFGMVVVEALAREIPVIASKGTPWIELNGDSPSTKCGWWVDHGLDHLIYSLNEVIRLSDDERHTFGINGRKLVESKYSKPAVAHDMKLAYEWLLYGNNAPDFLRLD